MLVAPSSSALYANASGRCSHTPEDELRFPRREICAPGRRRDHAAPDDRLGAAFEAMLKASTCRRTATRKARRIRKRKDEPRVSEKRPDRVAQRPDPADWGEDELMTSPKPPVCIGRTGR